MVDTHGSSGERGVLRWGGLAGILGGLLFIAVFGVVAVFVGTDMFAPKDMIVRFPEIRAARTVENGLYLVVLIVWVMHFVALTRALRAANLAAALFGGALGIVGLAVLAVGALPHVATAPLADLYHASTATPADRAALVLMWQSTQGILDTFLITGLVILPVAVVLLGRAMLGTPGFGRGYGWVSILLGVVGVAAAVVLLIDPLSPVAALGIFALIGFHIAVGWRTLRLSKAA